VTEWSFIARRATRSSAADELEESGREALEADQATAGYGRNLP
jgi:hypothetical protein